MDYSMIGAAASAITVSKELAKAALGIRDFNEIAPAIAKLNDQLLKAQDALFTHQSHLLALQQEHADLTEKLRKAEKALAERGRYALVELAPGHFVYRSKVDPDGTDTSKPGGAEPVHHVCQRCFDSGIKTVLQQRVQLGMVELVCTACRTEFDTGLRRPF